MWKFVEASVPLNREVNGLTANQNFLTLKLPKVGRTGPSSQPSLRPFLHHAFFSFTSSGLRHLLRFSRDAPVLHVKSLGSMDSDPVLELRHGDNT